MSMLEWAKNEVELAKIADSKEEYEERYSNRVERSECNGKA